MATPFAISKETSSTKSGTDYTVISTTPTTPEIPYDGDSTKLTDNLEIRQEMIRTMIDPRCDCIGMGVTQYDGIAYCYMFVGIPNSVNFYA